MPAYDPYTSASSVLPVGSPYTSNDLPVSRRTSPASSTGSPRKPSPRAFQTSLHLRLVTVAPVPSLVGRSEARGGILTSAAARVAGLATAVVPVGRVAVAEPLPPPLHRLPAVNPSRNIATAVTTVLVVRACMCQPLRARVHRAQPSREGD